MPSLEKYMPLFLTLYFLKEDIWTRFRLNIKGFPQIDNYLVHQ
jgi:hypothetical protein